MVYGGWKFAKKVGGFERSAKNKSFKVGVVLSHKKVHFLSIVYFSKMFHNVTKPIIKYNF